MKNKLDSDLVGKEVVVDTKSPIVYIGVLESVKDDFIALRDVDVHDINDTSTTKEVYILQASKFGIKKNRSNVHIFLSEIVSISKLDDIIQY